MKVDFATLETHWSALSPILVVRNEEDYDRAIGYLNALLDEVGMDEVHPLYELLDTLGNVLYSYEEACYKIPDVSGREMLRFFMEEHGLTQLDLPEVGSQDVVSELLSGKRKLNTQYAHILAKRFCVSKAVFLKDE